MFDAARAYAAPVHRADLRSTPVDFQVTEELGFAPSGEGEHCFLNLEKVSLNTTELAQRLARLAGVPVRDVGFSGMKDRNAVTRQWFSVGLAGRKEPDWSRLEDESVRLLQVTRHARKLRRGVHRGNRFRVCLRRLQGDRGMLEQRLQQVAELGAPNYFGEQRFGRGGANVVRARNWLQGRGPAPRRNQRSIVLSALRSELFNRTLSARVAAQRWRAPEPGDACMLAGTRSLFQAEADDGGLQRRAEALDVHVALPLWGAGDPISDVAHWQEQRQLLADFAEDCEGLEAQGLRLDYRSARLLADDICWQFCDDGSLTLSFGLQAGSYATSLLRELLHYEDCAGRGAATPVEVAEPAAGYREINFSE